MSFAYDVGGRFGEDIYICCFVHTHTHIIIFAAPAHTLLEHTKPAFIFYRGSIGRILFLCEYKFFFAETRQAEDTPPLGEHICCASHTHAHSHTYYIYIYITSPTKYIFTNLNPSSASQNLGLHSSRHCLHTYISTTILF
ncbi:hypothetical protein K449DRAFT_1557 [Hypoxylon sp. EC38]|nr:hypothetical protein K449DRAFT_1557 [Hypoxylon sp. EC38]